MSDATTDERIAELENRVARLEGKPPAPPRADSAGRYDVNDGLLWSPAGDAVEWRASPNKGGVVKARTGIVAHYTAGRSFDHTTKWFERDSSDVSAHILISKVDDDPVRQFVGFGERAWHVGKSEWRGRRSCNGFMLGVELDNAGPLNEEGRDRWGQQAAEVFTAGDGRLWEAYPEHQIEKFADVVRAMVRANEGIVDVIGHQHCAKPDGRKRDPGPAFPWEKLEELLEGTDLRVGP